MLKVLLVDDEPIIRHGLKNGFDWESNDCMIVGEAANGFDAMLLIEKTKPDVVITDICMPKSNGLELIKEIKNYNKEIEIIVISGYDNFTYAQESLNMGVFAYLLKPIDLNKFSEVLSGINEKALEKNKSKKSEIVYNSVKTEELILSILANPQNAEKIMNENRQLIENFHNNYFVANISLDNIRLQKQTLFQITFKIKNQLTVLLKPMKIQ